MSRRKSSKVTRANEAKLVDQILKEEEQEKSEKEKVEREVAEAKERKFQELKQKKLEELRLEYTQGEGKMTIAQQMQQLKNIYEKKYELKLDKSAKEMSKAEKMKTVITEETLYSRFGYNIVPRKIPKNAHSIYCNVNRRDEKPIAVKITDLKKVPSRKKSLTEDDVYKVLAFLKTHRNEHIITIYDAVLCGEKFFFFQEPLVDDLETYLTANGAASEEKSRKIMRDVGEGLLFLHTNAIFHHNVCAHTVLLDKAAKVAKVTGFEYSAIYWDQAKKEERNFAPVHEKTVKYASPEERSGSDVNVKADIWGWAAVAVFAVCREYPPVTEFEVFKEKKLTKVSEDFIDLMKKCFGQPKERPGMSEVLSQLWFKDSLTLVK